MTASERGVALDSVRDTPLEPRHGRQRVIAEPGMGQAPAQVLGTGPNRDPPLRDLSFQWERQTKEQVMCDEAGGVLRRGNEHGRGGREGSFEVELPGESEV